jgi:hypothetical protein
MELALSMGLAGIKEVNTIPIAGKSKPMIVSGSPKTET